MLEAKHANLMSVCITYYIYAYQLHCPKQDVLRTSKLLPKVVICINIIRYTCWVYRACFYPNIIFLHNLEIYVVLYKHIYGNCDGEVGCLGFF